MNAATDVFIPIPPGPAVRQYTGSSRHDYWSSEKECHAWLLDVLCHTYEIQVFDEPRLVDIYGNKARADIGVLLYRNGNPLFFVIEIKCSATLSTNASQAFIQAYHYREMCVVDDQRLPSSVNGKSPTFSFAGVFVSSEESDRDHHEHRCDGMGILAANMKVGNAYFRQRHGVLLFRAGDMRLFSVPVLGDGPIDWQTTADAYLFGRERRNGGRRDRQTVAEKFFEMQQTFKELF